MAEEAGGGAAATGAPMGAGGEDAGGVGQDVQGDGQGDARQDGDLRPRRRPGISAARRALFLTALARSGNVSAAARSVEVPSSCFHDLRRRDAEFAAQWRQALDDAYEAVEGALLAKAGMDGGGGGGEGALDVELALRLLRMRQDQRSGRTARAQVTHRPIATVADELLRRLKVVARRRSAARGRTG